jgi:ribosome biogenesis ATPase
MVDPAMVRPGRLDKLLYVDLPSPAERADILAAHARRTPLADGVDLSLVALDGRCNGFSGADLAALVREAAVGALQEALRHAASAGLADADVEAVRVGMPHFDLALNSVAPSVSAAQRRRYEALRNRFAGQPVGRHDEVAATAAATQEAPVATST